MEELPHQVREIRIAIYIFSDEPALRRDLQAQFPNLFKRALNETAANTLPSQREWHLGVEDCHHAIRQPIICDGNPSTGIQL